jgi:hypothetical protein
MFFECQDKMINIDNILFVEYIVEQDYTKIYYPSRYDIFKGDIRPDIRAFIKHANGSLYPNFTGGN